MLTVVVLTYNHESTIERAIESILSQQTAYSYKVIIAEDASTDNTKTICERLLGKHPNLIELIAQPVNTKALHIRDIVFDIESKYFTILEGDDYWCSNEKIQKSISFLETHHEYQIYAHDTNYHDCNDVVDRSLVHDIYKKKIENPMDFDSMVYLHTSSRIYRNDIDLRTMFNNKMLFGDIYLLYAYLDKGNLYYNDEVMSVYNISGTGSWSKLSRAEKIRGEDEAAFVANKMLGYRRDNFFTGRVHSKYLLRRLKMLLGKRLGWRIYLSAAYLLSKMEGNKWD